MSKQKNKFQLIGRLRDLGFDYDESVALLRIESTLQRWAEGECGDSNDYASTSIERDEQTGKPYRVIMPHSLKPSQASRYPIPDREAGALKRLRAIMANKPDLWFFHQIDPRGCALYVGRKSSNPDLNDANIDSLYTRGLAVCV